MNTINHHESKALPGLRYATRTLNFMQRAKRDAEISAERLEYTRLATERGALVKALIPNSDTLSAEDRAKRLQEISSESTLRLLSLDDQLRLIHDGTLAPATIRAALVSLEGGEINGEPVTMENLFEIAPDGLLDEISLACDAASGLTKDEQKN